MSKNEKSIDNRYEYTKLNLDSSESDCNDDRKRSSIRRKKRKQKSHTDNGEPKTRSQKIWTSLLHATGAIHLTQRRYYMAFMGFLGFCNVYAMRANLSIAILQMTNGTNRVMPDGSVRYMPGEFQHWNSVTKGIILSAFFYGYILTQIPGGWLARKYGGHPTFLIGIFGTALLTIMTPPVAHFGSGALVVIRVLEGIFEGVTYPAMHAIWSNWAPSSEKTKLTTIAFAGSYFGTVISLPASAALGNAYGWPSIFYVFGLLGVLWCFVWYKTVFPSVDSDPFITPEEASYIKRSIGYTEAQGKQFSPPWREILISKAVWAISIAHFAENWGFYTMLTYLPKYMEQVLHMTLSKASFATSLPYLMMGIVLILAGQLADHLREVYGMSTGLVRKSFGSGALVAQMLFTVLTVQTENYILAQVFITLSVGLGGFAWSGFSVNQLDIAPQYASILMGLSNSFATIPGMISPILVGAIVTTGTQMQWHLIFYIAAVIYLWGGVMYALWASGDVQTWATMYSEYDDQEVVVGGGPQRNQGVDLSESDGAAKK